MTYIKNIISDDSYENQKEQTLSINTDMTFGITRETRYLFPYPKVFTELTGEMPSYWYNVNNMTIDYIGLLNDIESIPNIKKIFQLIESGKVTKTSEIAFFDEDTKVIYIIRDTGYKKPADLTKIPREGETKIRTASFETLHSIHTDKSDEFKKLVDKNVLQINPTTTINMLGIEDGQYITIQNNLKLGNLNNNLDLHYGKKFKSFYDKLINSMQKTDKGLIIFSGLPGTGKSSLIRQLIPKISDELKKHIIIMPASLLHAITDPNFLDFMMANYTVDDDELDFTENYDDNADKKGVVLIVEDAEPLLVSETGKRTPAMSAILNFTDGIYNDFIDMQILCTINTDIKSLDKALLRPGRLLTSYYFDELTVEEGNALLESLNCEKRIDKPTVLSNIYALVNDSDIFDEYSINNDSKNNGML